MQLVAAGASIEPVVVLEKSPSVMLVALFMRGFWLEVVMDDQGRTRARYLHGDRQVAAVRVGLA